MKRKWSTTNHAGVAYTKINNVYMSVTVADPDQAFGGGIQIGAAEKVLIVKVVCDNPRERHKSCYLL